MKSDERLIVALDLPDFKSACAMVERLGESVSFYKIGLEMMMSGDYFRMVEFLKNKGKKVFCDLKLYDIPETIARSVRNLAKLDIDFLTIHCASREIMERAAEEKGGVKLLGVTVLTCLDGDDLFDMGFKLDDGGLDDLVLKKARLALDCGIDGIVSSALEVSKLRDRLGDDFLTVTPGIRLSGGFIDDQKRVLLASEAIANGADYLVVGRPITRSDDPKGVVGKFLQEIGT